MKQCPSCGRPVDFEEKYSRILACGYCNSVLEFWEWEINKIWEQSEFIEFPSIFEVWNTIDWKWKEVSVKWQLRYEYDWGFFDVFFVTIDSKSYYIHEDDWTQILIQNWEWNDTNLTLIDKTVWSKQNIWGNDVFVQENGLFTLASMKWFVDTDLIPWDKYEYLDGVVSGSIYHFEKIIWKNKVRVNKEVSL